MAVNASQFVAVVLADTEDVWNDLFERRGEFYEEPNLVLFTGQVRSACGFANAAVGAGSSSVPVSPPSASWICAGPAELTLVAGALAVTDFVCTAP